MAHGQNIRVVGLGRNDPIYSRIRQEAEEAVVQDPRFGDVFDDVGVRP